MNEITAIVTQHSKVAGGSTCGRIMQCPGSVALCASMPPKPSSKYADEGTLLHNVIAEHLDKGALFESFIGATYGDAVLTQELIDEKLHPILNFLNEVDPHNQMEFAVEAEVSFGDFIPGAFGSVDLIGRLGDTAIVWDHKFGSGVAVSAEENPQLLYYTAAAMRTPGLEWVFKDAKELLCVIAQPPSLKQWRTTLDQPKKFEQELLMAVKIAQLPDAPIKTGDHCRWCAAKPTCPKMTGAVDRALAVAVGDIDVMQISRYLAKADMLEQWVTDLRALAHTMLEAGVVVPDWKLVAKRATRQWVDEDQALVAMMNEGLPEDELIVSKVISPAQAEKVLKKHGKQLPADQVVAVSSGNTLVAESDPRPAVLQIGQQLSAALSKLI